MSQLISLLGTLKALLVFPTESTSGSSLSEREKRYPFEVIRTELVDGKLVDLYTGYGSDNKGVAEDMRDEMSEGCSDAETPRFTVRPNPAFGSATPAPSMPLGLTEHALAVLVEECAEVIQCAASMQQLACKALRFGLDDGYPGADRTNRESMVREFNDLIGAMEHLQESTPLNGLFDREQVEAKKQRIKHWHAHAMANGTLAKREEH